MRKPLSLRKPGVGDIVAISFLILISAVSCFFIFRKTEESSFAVITTADVEFEVDLSDDADYSFESNGFSYTATVNGGAISITHANCPDGICKRTAAIKDTSSVIVCLPGKVSVRCKGVGTRADADYVIP